MRSQVRLIASALAAVSVVLAACGSGEVIEASTEPPAAVAEPVAEQTPAKPAPAAAVAQIQNPPVTLPVISVQATGDDQELVALEARWLCDVQKRAFAELSDVDDAKSALLANSGIETTAYEDFKVRLESDTDLRMAVLSAFQSDCQS